MPKYVGNNANNCCRQGKLPILPWPRRSRLLGKGEQPPTEKKYLLPNRFMKQKTILEIETHLAKARAKHPLFATNEAQAICIAAEEFGEWSKEINEGKIELAREECLDLLAVLIRYLQGE